MMMSNRRLTIQLRGTLLHLFLSFFFFNSNRWSSLSTIRQHSRHILINIISSAWDHGLCSADEQRKCKWWASVIYIIMSVHPAVLSTEITTGGYLPVHRTDCGGGGSQREWESKDRKLLSRISLSEMNRK